MPTSTPIEAQDDLFGYYCTIEMKRFGVPNEMYQHKIIGRLKSNSWVEVPVQGTPTVTLHDFSDDVINVICCGVVEERVYRVRLKDVSSIHSHVEATQKAQLLAEVLEALGNYHTEVRVNGESRWTEVVYWEDAEAAITQILKAEPKEGV